MILLLMARPPALRVSPDRQVTASDIDCLKEAFALFDCDRDGEISVEELGKVGTAQSSSVEYLSKKTSQELRRLFTVTHNC